MNNSIFHKTVQYLRKGADVKPISYENSLVK